MFSLALFKKQQQKNKKLQASRNKNVEASSASLKPFVFVAFVGLTLFIVLLIQQQVSQKVWFPITQVSVIGATKEVNASQLENDILDDLNSSFFALKLDQLADQVEMHSWVAEATLRRVWPNKIEVFIREHQPVALWNENALMSANGVVFKVATTVPYQNLVKISGKQRDSRELLFSLSDLNQLIAKYDVYPVDYDYRKAGELKVLFNNSLEVIFSLEDKQVQFKRFAALLANGFMSNEKNVQRIDMRYSNGFSVKWVENKSSSLAKKQALLFKTMQKSEKENV